MDALADEGTHRYDVGGLGRIKDTVESRGRGEVGRALEELLFFRVSRSKKPLKSGLFGATPSLPKIAPLRPAKAGAFVPSGEAVEVYGEGPAISVKNLGCEVRGSVLREADPLTFGSVQSPEAMPQYCAVIVATPSGP